MLAVADKGACLRDSLHASRGVLADTTASAAGVAVRAAAALWRRDPSAWSDDPAVQKKITDRLGWLSSPELMAESIDRLQRFAAGVVRDRFTDVVLLGMGGSSLAPEVLRSVIGVAPGFPRFQVLDSTDPAAIRTAETPHASTLYVVASKSGTTIEPTVLAAHFRERLIEAGIARWPDQFIAITDEGTDLERRAREERFRDVFINPSDIGGRYSAISFFGMVPAALMGIDLASIIGWALAMLEASASWPGPATTNPAVALGLMIAEAARAGRDKLTLILPPSLESFGLWVEHLIAESTGKSGVGVIPIACEPPGDASVYGPDRLFVRVRSSRTDQGLAFDLGQAPVIDVEIPDPTALGAEFVRWEIATAIAGAILKINPFDEPNVQQAKDATRKLLGQCKSSGQLPMTPPDRTLDGGIDFTLSTAARKSLKPEDASSILRLVSAGDPGRPGDYVGLLAYLSPDRALAEELRGLRRAIRDRTHAPTMFGYGPRYLHSTGQLHKGGPHTGVFVLITATPDWDLPVPGEPFSFGTLELAQALGDFASLDAGDRRVVHAHMAHPDPALIRTLATALLAGA